MKSIYAEKIQGIFIEKLNTEVPPIEADLFEEAHLDSVKFVELLMALEQEFGINIILAELDFENFQTIGKIAEFVSRQAVDGR